MHSSPKLPSKLSLLLMASACSGISFAASDAPPETAALPEVTVTDTSMGYRTTGTKSELKPMDAPMSYEVYDNELLTARQVDTVNEALRYVPGVTPESRPTVTIFDQYTIRGFESYRNYYDGLPLQYNGLWNLAPQVDAFATQSIEVLKGPTSVLYGSAPPGGMVNQTAKQPQSQQQNLLRTRIGTNNLRELALDSTGPLSENVDYRLIALTRSRDGQQKTTEEERHTIAPSLTWRISKDTKVNFNAYYQKDPDLIPSTPLPSLGTLYAADYGKLDSDAYAGDKNWNKFEREVTMAGWKFEHNFNDDVTFLQNFRHTDGSALQRNTYHFSLQADGRTLDRSAYFTDEAINGYVVDNQLAVKFNAGATKHRLLIGAEYQKLNSTVRYGDTYTAGTPTIDLADPNYNLINPGTLPFVGRTEDHDIRQSQLGLYIQDEMQLGALTLVGGLRRDRYKIDDDAVIDGAPSPTKISQRETTGRIAALYKFENGLAPYVNYSESFEPTPGTDSLTGSAFKPTTAKQVEAGVKFKPNGGRTELTAAYFDLKKQNVVINTLTLPTQYTQTGEVQSKGVELSWRQMLTDKVDVTLALADLDAKVTKNELNPAIVGKTPIWVADKQASVWMNYYATADLELSGGVRYVGKSPIDELNTAEIPSYTLVDLAGSYRLNKTFRLGLTVSNLFDKRYVGACSSSLNCWMGAERSVELSLYTTF